MLRRIGWLMVAALLAGACNESTAPAVHPQGTYALISIDGHPMPYILGTDSSVRRTLELDELTFGDRAYLEEHAWGRSIPEGGADESEWFTEPVSGNTYESLGNGTISFHGAIAGLLTGGVQGTALVFADQLGRRWRFEPSSPVR